MLHVPHHDGSELYVSNLNPTLGERVRIRLRVPQRTLTEAVWVRLVYDGEPTFVEAQLSETNDIESWWHADVTVQNKITNYRWRLTEPDRWITQAGMIRHDPTDLTDFRLVSHSAPPDWATDAVFYQIFPDRFARSSDADSSQQFPDWCQHSSWNEPVNESMPNAMTQLYGGDFRGVVDKLDHLESLGVNAIYSTPYFPGRSNHRYDASTFDYVDPLLGGDRALATLVDELHQRGMRFIGDLTTNHSGVTHEWFEAAQADAASEEAEYYTFANHPNDYEAWLGIKSLPKFNYESKKLRARLIADETSTVRRFLNPPFSIDGWRIDVANMTGRLGSQDLNHVVARGLRSAMHLSSPESLLIAEHCHDATRDLEGDGWYSTMNYAGFANPITSWLGSWFPPGIEAMPAWIRPQDGREIQQTIDGFAAAISWRTRSVNLNLLDSHDSVRFRSIVSGSPALHSVGTTLLMTFPGIPSVFQGDEFGMEGQHSHVTRSPIQWNAPHLHCHATLDHHRKAIGARRTNIALRRGGFRWVSVGADHLTFLREHRESVVLVHVSRGGPVPTNDILHILGEAGYRSDRMCTELLSGADTVLRDALRFGTEPGSAVLSLH
jgi:alpha-glucosidase